MLSLDTPAVITLTGKGNKTRRVPIMKNTASLLQSYLVENKLDKPWKNEYPLFTNNQHHKLTKEGVAYIISKYVAVCKENINSRAPESESLICFVIQKPCIYYRQE